MLRDVDYMRLRGAVRAHPGFTNVVKCVPCPSVYEVVYVEEFSENGRKRMV